MNLAVSLFISNPAFRLGRAPARRGLPEAPSINREQDCVQQPDGSKTESNAIDEERDVAGQRDNA